MTSFQDFPANHVADWLALAIGNSRLHWAWFQSGQLQIAWDTPHLPQATVLQLIATQFDFAVELRPSAITLPKWPQPIALCIASVVPAQTTLWQPYTQACVLTLADIPLQNCYPSLGIDRALTLWGAIQQYGAPVLVIDGGTALTFTGADAQRRLVGGAILPGVRTLFQTLDRATAALPDVLSATVSSAPAAIATHLPNRWATNTAAAIHSGIIHTVTAGLTDFIADWWNRYGSSPIVFTGGDGAQLKAWWNAANAANSNQSSQILWDPQLIFAGMQAVVLRMT